MSWFTPPLSEPFPKQLNLLFRARVSKGSERMDAGAVSTYTQAGAQYGMNLLWLLLLLLPITYFWQVMVVRLGNATGKGHAGMIYKGECGLENAARVQ